MVVRISVWIYILASICFHITAGTALGCPACWAGYGPGAERFNKALADLRKQYEMEGKAAAPVIRQTLKTSDNPPVQQRAMDYIGALQDVESVPLLEDIIYELVKRVSFSSFGVGSAPFQTRLKAAHTLAVLGDTGMADKIWRRYERIDQTRKTEVPYILNALGDPRLSERLKAVINRCKDHQVMIGALDAMAIGGSAADVTFLKTKIDQWHHSPVETAGGIQSLSTLEYSIWRIKAQNAIVKIEQQTREP